jgi:hypothetical protein
MPHNTLEANRIQKERQRLRERLEKEEELSKDPVNLNYGMKPIKEIFPSMDDYLAANPDKSKTDYIHLKIEWDRETVQNQNEEQQRQLQEVSKLGNLEPLNPKCQRECVKFRIAYMNRSPDLGLIHQNHNCVFCDKWLIKFKKELPVRGLIL